MVLVILAVIWAAVLLPPYLQNRSQSRPADSISSFQRQLSVLEHRSHVVAQPPRTRAAGAPLVQPVSRYAMADSSGLRMSRSEQKKRRRDILFTLAGAAGLTFAMALVLGGPVWMLQLMCDALLGGYVFLLVQIQQRSIEREAKVRYLPQRHARQAEPQLLLRRSGS